MKDQNNRVHQSDSHVDLSMYSFLSHDVSGDIKDQHNESAGYASPNSNAIYSCHNVMQDVSEFKGCCTYITSGSLAF